MPWQPPQFCCLVAVASHRLLAGVSVLLPAAAVPGRTEKLDAASAHPAVAFAAG